MRTREVSLVAAREMREATRQRWFLCAAASFLVMSLGLAALGLAGAERSGLAGFDRTTASLLNLTLLFVPLLTLSLGSLGIAGEMEDGSLGALLAQPLTRAEVYAGKYLGMLLAVWASILAGLGTTGIVVGLRSEGGNARAFLMLVGLMLALSAATLALGTFLSAAIQRRVRVAGAAFAAWFVLVYVSDLGTIALTIARELRPGQVFALALLNPIQQARVLGTMLLTDRADVLGPAGLYGVDTFGEVGLALLLASTLALTALGFLAAGYASFRKAVLS